MTGRRSEPAGAPGPQRPGAGGIDPADLAEPAVPADQAERSDGAGVGPLDGLRVLDLARVLSGPYVGRMLSDLGADVVKVEPPGGDVTRHWGRQVAGLSGYFTQQNAGKRNIGVDLGAEGGAELVAGLAAVADVVIENFRPGVLARHGLAYDDLCETNPHLVMLSITGFGQTGPETHRQAYAPVLHAESGVLARQAHFDGRPATDFVLSVADTNAALHGLVGVMAALAMRERTGRGAHVDLAMLDAMVATDDYVHHALDGDPAVRLGGQVFPARWGEVLISSEPKYLWAQLRDVHGLVDPTPPGASLTAKIEHRRGAIARWVAAFDDPAALHAALAEANLASAEVRASAQVVDAPSLAHREAFVELDDRAGGTRRVVRAPYRMTGAAVGPRRPAAHRGEHDAEVLAEWLGVGADGVEVLADAGVLGRPAP